MSLTTSQKHLNLESATTLKTGHRRKLGCALVYLLFGFISLFLGCLSIRYDFLKLALNERIRLRPGLPPFEKWRNPTGVEFAVKVFLFAVENPDEFLADNNTKLRLKEIGPIYYKKTMRQEDIEFHDEDSTMTFSTVSHLEYVEEMNEPGILNKTITIMNPILLSLAAMIHNQFLAKVAFDLAAKKDHVFIKQTVYEALWNSTSPMLELVKKIPFAAPRPNAGVMYNSFYPKPTRYNVNIGPKHGFENFFKINTLNGMSRINVYEPSYPKHCPFSLKGASEGTGLPPMISKDTVIQAYTAGLCRTYPMIYNQTVKVGALDAYEFVFSPDVYRRTPDPRKDCLRQTGGAILPDGLIDTSKCAFGTPMALSNPHFWGFKGEWGQYIEGLAPQQDRHSSYIHVEPTSGIQLEAVVRIQSNIPLPALDYYPPNIKRFSKMILPQFWLECDAHNRDPVTLGMILIVINLPVIQPIVVIILFAVSVLMIYNTVKLMIALNVSRSWSRTKEQHPGYGSPTVERYFGEFKDGLERTAF